MGTNAASHIKGTIAEIHFEKKLEVYGGALYEHPDDHDTSRRYDHYIVTNDKSMTFECKMGSKAADVQLCFKDKRPYTLPSGEIWDTHARHVDEGFDVLAVCMFNFTRSYDDFIYLPKEQFPRYQPNQKERAKYCETDLQFMKEHFFSKTVKFKGRKRRAFVESLEDLLQL
jgi:hypothetical protein